MTTQDKANVIQTLKNIQTLRKMAKDSKKPAEMLRFLVLTLNIEQQLELMMIFSEAFNVTLGEVTAITGWWHDDSAEMNDNDINAYMMPVITEYLASLDQI